MSDDEMVFTRLSASSTPLPHEPDADPRPLRRKCLDCDDTGWANETTACRLWCDASAAY